MSNSMIPRPNGVEPDTAGTEQAQRSGGDEGVGAGAGRNRQQRRPKKPAIPSPDECARAIAQLAGLIAMGMLKPAQANAIRAAFRDILQHHKSKAKEAEKSLSNADVMDLLRKDPKMLNLLSPLLTSEQIDMVMGTGSEDKDAEA